MQGTLATAGMRYIHISIWSGAYDIILRPSVCPIKRPQPQRAAGLRLSTARTPPAVLLHWSQHGTQQQCHVHS